MGSIRLDNTLALAIGAAAIAWGQTASDNLPKRGSRPHAAINPSDIETISRTNGNLNLRIPIASLPPGKAGHTWGMTLIYNSKIWDPGVDATSGQPGLAPSSFGGWHYGLGYQLRIKVRPNPTLTSCENVSPDYKYAVRLYVEDPDGTMHLMRYRGYIPANQSNLLTTGNDDPTSEGYYSYYPDGRYVLNALYLCPTTTPSLSGTLVYYSNDSSFLRLEVQRDNNADNNPDNNPWTLFLPDGRRVEGGFHPSTGLDRPQAIFDRNDNRIDITHSFDTLGSAYFTGIEDLAISGNSSRDISIAYGGQPFQERDDYVTYPGYGGTRPTAQIRWDVTGSRAVQYTCGLNTPCAENAGTKLVVSRIDLPVGSPNLTYLFDYTAPGANTGWGQLQKMTLPSGAEIEYDYAMDSVSNPRYLFVLSDYVKQRKLSYTDEAAGGGATSETSTLSMTIGQTGMQAGTVTGSTYIDPAGRQTETFIHAYGHGIQGDSKSGLVYKTVHPDGSKQYSRYSQNAPPGTSWAYDPNNIYANAEVQTGSGTGAMSAWKTRSVNGNGTVTSSAEYDWEAVESEASSGELAATASPDSTKLRRSQGRNPKHTTLYWEHNTGPRSLGLTNSEETSGGLITVRSEYCYNTAENIVAEARLRTGYATGLVDCPSFTLTAAGGAGVAVLWKHTYDGFGNRTSTTDPRGSLTTYTYDSNNLYLEKKELADGQTYERTFSYTTDSNTGLVKSEKDDDNNATTAFDYDFLGRPTSITLPNGGGTSFSYNDNSRVVVTTRSLSADQETKTAEHYDQVGRVWLTRSSDDTEAFSGTGTTTGVKVKTLHKLSGGSRYELTSTPHRQDTDATRGWTLRQFDGADRLIRQEAYSGSVLPTEFGGANTISLGKITTSYGGPDQTICDEAATTIPRPAANPGACRTLTHDPLGRLVTASEETTSGLESTTYTYDAADNLRGVTQDVQSRTFSYNNLSQLTSAMNPESGATTYDYDHSGNLIERVDARGASVGKMCYAAANQTGCTGPGYDLLNRPLRKNYLDGSTRSVLYTYDANLRLPEDTQTNYYKGRLAKIEVLGGTVIEYNRFDINGQVADHSQITAGERYRFKYAYNLAGQRTFLVYPSGRAVATSYTGAGRIAKVEEPGATIHFTQDASAAMYAPHGALAQVRLGNGLVETRAYNAKLQITGLAVTPQLFLTYGYLPASAPATANNGNVITHTINGVNPSQSFEYDRRNRLTKASEGTAFTRTFNYDRYGNMWVTNATPAVPSGVPTSSGWYTQSTNRMTGAGNFDAAGNQTTRGSYTMAYDGEGRMKSSAINGGTTLYDYDGEGRRVRTATPTGPGTTWVYDADGQLALEIGPDAASSVRYPLVDALGSVRAVTDGSGGLVSRRDYMPFGEEFPVGINGRNGFWSAEPGVKQKFTGKERDAESNLDYFTARFASSFQGRFMSPDPESGTPTDPQSWNMYAYARNNPMVYTDPTGRSYTICNTDEVCGLYTDEEYDDLRSDNRFIVANGNVYERRKNGTQGRLLGTARHVDRDLDPVGRRIAEDLAANADRSLRTIGAFAVAAPASIGATYLLTAGGSASLAYANVAAFGAATGRVFWSGGAEGIDAALKANVGRVINQTPLGGWFERFANTRLGSDSQVTKEVWNVLSRLYAAGASGTVHVFSRAQETERILRSNPTILMRTELPTLLANPNVNKIVYPSR